MEFVLNYTMKPDDKYCKVYTCASELMAVRPCPRPVAAAGYLFPSHVIGTDHYLTNGHMGDVCLAC
jgi:hypothetical protein